ncbi:MAG: flagellin lysine-N-methylase [Cellulosilyticaceae bacterium]
MKKEIHQQIVPSYYEDFRCIGGACEDTCCAGWQLPIDEETYKRYKKVKHPDMKRRLNKELVEKKGSADPEYAAKIKLKNNSCAFLAKDGLCDVYKQLGEDYMSHSCKCYPRTMNEVGGRIEYSMTTSCPEVTRKVLLATEGITFREVEKMPLLTGVNGKVAVNTQNPKSWRDYLFLMRDWIIACLQQRALPLEERLAVIQYGVEEMESLLVKGKEKELPKLVEKLQKSVSKKENSANAQEMQDLAHLVKKVMEEKKVRIAAYKEILEQVLQSLSVEDKASFAKAYEKGVSDYYQPFLEKESYMLENYFVNYVYERCMPLDGKSPKESFKRMMLYYHLIKLHLIGVALSEGELNAKNVVKVVQSFTKVYDHGERYIEKIIENR